MVYSSPGEVVELEVRKRALIPEPELPGNDAKRSKWDLSWSSGSDEDSAYGSTMMFSETTSDFVEEDVVYSYDDACVTALPFSTEIFDNLCLMECEKSFSDDFINMQMKGVDEGVRKRLIRGFFRAKFKFSLTLETIHLSIFLLDKCLDSSHIADKVADDVAAVILVLASKLEEYHPLTFRNVIEAKLTTVEDLKVLGDMEKRILFNLNYSLSHATPFTFANYFHYVRKSEVPEVMLTNFLLEVSSFQPGFRNCGSVVLALSCVLLAKLLTVDPSCLHFWYKETKKVLTEAYDCPTILIKSVMSELITEVNIELKLGSESPTLKSYQKKEGFSLNIPSSLITFLED